VKRYSTEYIGRRARAEYHLEQALRHMGGMSSTLTMAGADLSADSLLHAINLAGKARGMVSRLPRQPVKEAAR
jgi:hypothetical protein